jgi:hypothetical protein
MFMINRPIVAYLFDIYNGAGKDPVGSPPCADNSLKPNDLAFFLDSSNLNSTSEDYCVKFKINRIIFKALLDKFRTDGFHNELKLLINLFFIKRSDFYEAW